MRGRMTTVSPAKHASPFDINMALDNGFDSVTPYTNVTLDQAYTIREGDPAPKPAAVRPFRLRSAAAVSR